MAKNNLINQSLRSYYRRLISVGIVSAVGCVCFMPTASVAELIELRVVKKPVVQSLGSKGKRTDRLGVSGAEAGLLPKTNDAAKIEPDPNSGNALDGEITKKDDAPTPPQSATEKNEALKEVEQVKTASIPLTISECSQRYHAELLQIKQRELASLNDMFDAARSSGARKGKKLLFRSKKRASSTERQARREAQRRASLSGGISLSPNSNSGWVARQIIYNLRTYVRQENRPYLCTGSRAFIDFIKPHASKLSPNAVDVSELLNEYRPVAAKAVENALGKLGQPALPILAPERSLDQSLNQTDLRGSVSENPKAEADTIESEGSELPLLNEIKPSISLSTELEIKKAIEQLLTYAVESNLLVEKRRRQEFVAVESLSGMQSNLAKENDGALTALISARQILNSNRFVPRDRRDGLLLENTLAALEILYFLGKQDQARPKDVGGAIVATLQAVERASIENCTCGR